MILNNIKPIKSLNKAYLKVKPNRFDIEIFKSNLMQLIDRTNDTESEEFHKNLVSTFLKDTYYKQNHFINTKGRNDLVIHNGNKAESTVGVIIEAKKPTNKVGMLTKDKINVKAFHELILYYLRERITHRNLEIKYLIATNINEWFIFDANIFEKQFAQNNALVKKFHDFENGRLAGKTTDFFYKEIAKSFINDMKEAIECTFFDIRAYEKLLRNDNLEDDNKLISLFKLLSPTHLLKLPFANDSNSLDRQFYNELLHIIGLSETKNSGKKLIERKKKDERNTGSLLENAVIELDTLGKIARLENGSQYGGSLEEQLVHVALELSITWVNRILFLKLLEAQLIAYHKGDESYSFLNFKKIKNYDDLNSLFFKVLAKKHNKRNEEVREDFAKVPYLNSSLFEPNELEQSTIVISNLRDEKELPIHSSTVLKDENGKKRTGKLNALEYFFAFLASYDFSSEGATYIQEENKTLINASVLGLIFEKINGYKEGSFFTPGFITIYMCRETIRRAVVQKFNESKGWKCENLDDIYDKIEDRKEANDIINSLKICDPAVGSGHFLVSALNEIISIKNDLKILQDREGKRLKEYHFEVVNDDLIVTDEDGGFFEYKPTNKESQRIQEALFHEKQTIIENCLFGVDINPNSVKICRLRLWIELLKNAYYKNETELETLPNIDINIKCGNSLISRFDLDADIKKALKKSKWTIDTYKIAVKTYHNAQNKEEKREMERLINDIKKDFQTEIRKNSKEQKQLDKLGEELYLLTGQGGKGGIGLMMFEPKEEYGTKENKKKRGKKIAKIAQEIEALTQKMEAIKSNKIYEKAFEWRFEFPEVLNDDGDFVGFDVVIGNPPYISHDQIPFKNFIKLNFESYEPFADTFCYFFELGANVIKQNGLLNFITSNSFLKAEYGKPLRDFFNKNGQFVQLINLESTQIFEDAIVNTVIANFQKNQFDLLSVVVNKKYNLDENFLSFIECNKFLYSFEDFSRNNWNLSSPDFLRIGRKIKSQGKTLEEYDTKIKLGIATGFNEAFVLNKETADDFILKDSKNKEIIKPLLRGRDIERYSYSQEKYILLTKNGVDVQNDYPVIFNYLNFFGDKFKKRGAKGQHWTNLRACSFFNDFKESKIIWIELTDRNRFTLCEDEIYLLNSAYFLIPPKNINKYFLTGLLNSLLIQFYLKLIANTSGVGTTRWINIYVKEFPIALNQKINKLIASKVTQIRTLKKIDSKADTSILETKIDQLVYQLYGLTKAEIKIVEENMK